MLGSKLAAWAMALGAVSTVLAADRVPVTGVQVPNGGAVPLRQNINNVRGPQWDLLVRALQAMYDADPADPRSFFQIAGIHGKPYIEYNGAGGRQSSGWAGYCPHGEHLFLTWHRPYLALYEQELVGQARRLAAQYPPNVRAQYQQAADSLRAPFWDWGSDQSVPPATVAPRTRVNVPNGQGVQLVEVDNPFATFRFPQRALNGEFGQFDPQPRNQIYRCLSPNNYPGSANQNLQGRPYKQWIYDAFTRSNSFEQFASAEGGGVGLEQIHNGVHWDGACGGQFLSLDFTAYDPLFMLHHANVDRLWAYWEAIHTDQTVFSQTYEGMSRFATPEGTPISADSPLEPFFQASGPMHTSVTASRLRDFGYTYEGLEYWQKNPDQMRNDATSLINRLYGPSRGMQALGRFDAQQQTRYYVNLAVDVAQVERPSTINVFVNNMYAGNLVIMQQPGMGIKNGTIPLDDVVNASGFARQNPDRVVDSIKKSVQVSIVKGDGTPIPVSSVPSLKLEVEDIPFTPARDQTVLPKFGQPRHTPVQPADHPQSK
ncbi:hypothetical protein CDD81_2556 [Ophiocordyceps australis]|uniref:Tyrosinase copper-binding domain-containing protein n=1 Tax=Ophiocordyceps australis TaxID=1399860 RepID=A0A2C5XTP8_9HYPO|nr:hypothetical protein CDD81_2556 [Ophiocordyceps australis]